jgi:hypothetical protein
MKQMKSPAIVGASMSASATSKRHPAQSREQVPLTTPLWRQGRFARGLTALSWHFEFQSAADELGVAKTEMLGAAREAYDEARTLERYFPGASPDHRLKALLKATSESYPTRVAISASERSADPSSPAATCMRRRAT